MSNGQVLATGEPAVSDDAGQEPALSPKRKFLREVFYLSVIAIGIGVIGGIVWGLVAPRTQFTVVDAERYSFDPMSSAPVGADMVFMLIAVVCAVIFVLVAFKVAFTDLLSAWFGVLVGSFLGVLALYFVGIWLGNLSNAEPSELSVGETTDSALTIGASGVLFVWPMWAILIVAIVYWRRSRQVTRELRELAVPPAADVQSGPVVASSECASEPLIENQE